MTDQDRPDEKQQHTEQLLKLSVQHYRKQGVSEEDFLRWIQQDHIPRAARIIQKHNVVRYAQVSDISPCLGSSGRQAG